MAESEISKLIVDVVPPTMRALRTKFRAAVNGELTVPQWRVLAHLSRGVCDATALAGIQGVSLPAISRMLDTLAERGLVERLAKDGDRRQARLQPTPTGKNLYLRARRDVEKQIKNRLIEMGPVKQKKLLEGLQILNSLFNPGDQPPELEGGPT